MRAVSMAVTAAMVASTASSDPSSPGRMLTAFFLNWRRMRQISLVSSDK